MDKDDRDIINLEEKIKELRNKNTPVKEKQQENQGEDEHGKGSRAAGEFLASVIAGGILGYGVDWLFGTLPWGLLFFLIMGFVSAVYRANAAMKEEN